MISWIQRNFQRHFKVIFAVLLAVTVISFIATIGASPGIGRGDHREVNQPFFHYNLGSAEDKQRIFGDAALSIYFHNGFPAMNDERLQDYALHRAAILEFADQLHVPAPSAEQMVDYIRGFAAFAGSSGEFDPKRYASFRDNQEWTKLDGRLTATDVNRVISDDWRTDRVSRLIGGPGYVLTGDVKALLARTDTQWTISVATADYESYHPSITVKTPDVEKFFEKNSFRYTIPPRVSVSYVEFPAISFLGQVKLADAEVRDYYNANPARFPKPNNKNKPAGAKSNPEADFAAVRPQVELVMRLERAQALATQAASDFAVALYNEKITGFSPAFDAFLAARHLTLKSIPPFAQDAPPPELGASPDAAEKAFQLGKDHFASDPVGTPAGSAILFWKETQPSHAPLFAEVQAKVTADYKETQRQNAFFKLGQIVHDQLAARLKAGDGFDKAVAAVSAATGLKLAAKTLPPFTQRQAPPDIDKTVLGNIDELAVHQLSEMIFSENKGRFVYVAGKKQPDFNETNPQFVAARKNLAGFVARQTLNNDLSEIIANELKKSAPAQPSQTP